MHVDLLMDTLVVISVDIQEDIPVDTLVDIYPHLVPGSVLLPWLPGACCGPGRAVPFPGPPVHHHTLLRTPCPHGYLGGGTRSVVASFSQSTLGIENRKARAPYLKWGGASPT